MTSNSISVEELCLHPLFAILRIFGLHSPNGSKNYIIYVIALTLVILAIDVWALIGKFTAYNDLLHETFSGEEILEMLKTPSISAACILSILSSELCKSKITSFCNKTAHLDLVLGTSDNLFVKQRRRTLFKGLACYWIATFALITYDLLLYNGVFGWSVHKYFFPDVLFRQHFSLIFFQIYNYILVLKIRVIIFNEKLQKLVSFNCGISKNMDEMVRSDGNEAIISHVKTYEHISSCFDLLNEIFGLQMLGGILIEVLSLLDVLRLMLDRSSTISPNYGVPLHCMIFTFKTVSRLWLSRYTQPW